MLRNQTSLARMPHKAILRHMGRMCYKIRRNPRRRRSSFADLLSACSDLAVHSLNTGSQSGFDASLRVFEAVADEYISIAARAGLRYTSETVRGVLAEFHVVRALEHALRDVLEAVLRQSRRELLLVFSGFLVRFLSSAASNRDLMMFHQGVVLHVFMYWASLQYMGGQTAQLARHRARYNIVSCADHTLLRDLGESVDAETAEVLVELLHEALAGLEALLFHCLKERDLDSLDDIIRNIDEFLENWPIFAPARVFDDTKADSGLVAVREGMPGVIRERIRQIHMRSCAFLASEISKKGKADEFDQRAFEALCLVFRDGKTLLEALIVGLEESHGWSLWEEVPDTKRATVSDTSQRCLRFYLVRALQLQREALALPKE